MTKTLLLLILFSFFGTSSWAQQKYWVVLADKEGVSFNPHLYFHPKAIARRVKHNLPLVEETDKPIRKDYFQMVNSLSDTISGHSRWLNALACIVSSETQLTAIKNLPFVKEVRPMMSTSYLAEVSKREKDGRDMLLDQQIKWMQGELFENANLTGKGIRICIIDAGFPGVDQSEVFEHIVKRDGIVKTWDFHKNKPDVYKFHTHGSMVLSCIAGIHNYEKKIGLAPDADFLLARTELIFKEGLSEEEDWLMAVEWADKNGADIINSSLGYTTSLYFKENMDGKTSFVTLAGNIAAHKGILVVNAAGNEGDGAWKYIAAPADADSVLTVGGINPWSGIHTSFSSFGPTADKRMKPNVAAFGHVMAFSKYSILEETQGTSFASPLVAGFAACVLQQDTTLTAMELFEKLEKSANMYPYFDYAHGYGVPQAGYFTDSVTTEQVDITFDFSVGDENVSVVIKDEFFEINDEVVVNYDDFFYLGKSLKRLHIGDQYVSRDSNPKLKQPNYIYYHIENNDSYLREYNVIAPLEKEVIKINITTYQGETLRVWYKGYWSSVIIAKKEAEIEPQEENENDD